MKVDVVKIIDNYGYDKARSLILDKCYTLVEFHKEVGLSTSSSRTSSRIYKEAFEYLNIKEIPYKEDIKPIRLFKTEFDKHEGRYWESEYIVEFLLEKMKKPIVNRAGKSVRYVISFPKHPKADPTSNQIKAHIVLWELLNEMYVPEDCWVVPLDQDYTNLDHSNWVLRTSVEVKSSMFTGENNPSYEHGLAGRHKLGGWPKVSKEAIIRQPFCTKCNCTNKPLVVHHIINYHLFKQPTDAHVPTNLMVLCQSCHASIHQQNINIKALIEATQYSKLLELLETLKSQVPDTLIEIYNDVEKQLGLTDNQQPST